MLQVLAQGTSRLFNSTLPAVCPTGCLNLSGSEDLIKNLFQDLSVSDCVCPQQPLQAIQR